MNKSVFSNDPFVIIARAFKNIYGDIPYKVQFVPDLIDDGVEKWGETCFPDDGGVPIVSVSANLKVYDAVEVLAHELAHVATPSDNEHGKDWQEAFDKINNEYTRICERGGEDELPN